MKVGRVDTKRVDRFDMPVNERASVNFALQGLPAQVARLLVDGYVIATCKPAYDDEFMGKPLAKLNFFGADVPFHRQLVTSDVILQIECERVRDMDTMPTMRVGMVRNIMAPEPRQKVTINGVEKVLLYADGGCQFEPIA